MALTITPARFYSALNVPSTTITDLLRVTEAMCRRFLGLEPDAVLADTIDEDVFLEAMIRVAAYLISVEGAALASTDIGDSEVLLQRHGQRNAGVRCGWFAGSVDCPQGRNYWR